jgi:hypothetical protein
MEREPLEEWLSHVSRKRPYHDQKPLAQELDLIESWLDTLPGERQPDMPSLSGRWSADAQLKSTEVEHAQEIYCRVATTPGNGKTIIEETLLKMLAYRLDPAAIPFFVAMLDLAQPRDQFAARRRQFSLAALALQAYQNDHAGAFDALIQATRHDHPQVRALAVYYLRVIFVGMDDFQFAAGEYPPPDADDRDDTTRRPITPQLAERMAEIGTYDPAFEPRFMARRFLIEAGQALPLDRPDGSFALKVKLKWDKRTYRTIEIRSDQTLQDLQQAIQHSFDWDNDHLYSFFLNGRRDDNRYRFVAPWGNDGLPTTDEGVIGELGLILKHKFLYLFDYGDQHEFEIEVVSMCEQSEPGAYPRVVRQQGESPRQYHWSDDDE